MAAIFTRIFFQRLLYAQTFYIKHDVSAWLDITRIVQSVVFDDYVHCNFHQIYHFEISLKSWMLWKQRKVWGLLSCSGTLLKIETNHTALLHAVVSGMASLHEHEWSLGSETCWSLSVVGILLGLNTFVQQSESRVTPVMEVIIYLNDHTPRLSQRCSIGLLPGDFDGCFILLMPYSWIKAMHILAWWGVAQSPWQRKLLWKCCLVTSTTYSAEWLCTV